MIADNHNHIIYDDINSMVKAAKVKQLQRFSVTEHISQFKKPRSSIPFGSVHSKGRMFSDFEEYLLEFENLEDNGQEINRGLEVDFSPKFVSVVSGFVNEIKWDILLLSVHELENGLDVESKNLPQDKESSENRWREYIKLQESALTNDIIPFQVLTHPVRLGRSTQIVPEDIDQLLIDLAILAKKEKKALELNGNDVTRDYILVERLARACSVAGCEISFGSDAHHPNEVGRGFEQVSELVNRFNLKERQIHVK